MPPTSQQIKIFPPKRVKYLATPSSLFFSFFSSLSTGELSALSQSETRFVELGKYSQNMLNEAFLDPEYSFVVVRRILRIYREAKVRPIKNQLYSPNTPNYVREQMFAQLRTDLRPPKRKKEETKLETDTGI